MANFVPFYNSDVFTCMPHSTIKLNTTNLSSSQALNPKRIPLRAGYLRVASISVQHASASFSTKARLLLSGKNDFDGDGSGDGDDGGHDNDDNDDDVKIMMLLKYCNKKVTQTPQDSLPL